MSSVSQLFTQKVVGSESSTPPQSLTLQQEYLLKRQSNLIAPPGNSALSQTLPTRILDTPVFFSKPSGARYASAECQGSAWLDLLNGDFSELFGECRIRKFSFSVENFDRNQALNFSLKVNGKPLYDGTSITGTYKFATGPETGIITKISNPVPGDFTVELGTLAAGTDIVNVIIEVDSMIKLFHKP
jgi:hypothetical protein